MPDAWTLAWGNEHREVAVANSKHLSELLVEAAKDAKTSHTIAALVSPSGAELTIGLGRERSIATFKASMEPPYFTSRGVGSADELLVFSRDGHWSEFTGAEAIPVADAMAAVREFHETGQQPTCVEWREV